MPEASSVLINGPCHSPEQLTIRSRRIRTTKLKVRGIFIDLQANIIPVSIKKGVRKEVNGSEIVFNVVERIDSFYGQLDVGNISK